MVITINIPDNAMQLLKDLIDLITKILVIFGAGAATVKLVPTLPKGHWLLPFIKLLGKMTNDMSDNETIRAKQGDPK